MANKFADISLTVESMVDEVKKKENLQEAGDLMVERIKKRTRLGKGVTKPEGSATSLKPLEPTTVAVRKDLKKKGKLTGPNATPAKSGVNRTGATLESMTAVAKTGSVSIELDSAGEKVATELQKIDSTRFTFMNLSKAEVKVMTDFLEEKAQIVGSKTK